jgi:hypothetical protein
MKPFENTVLSRVLFKVDSGADLTTISKKELLLLGYSYEWIESNMIADLTRTLSRAGGKAEPAHYIQVQVFNLLGRDLVNWPLYIRKERHLDFPNLLGINVLTFFKFTFDFENWDFFIEVIPKPKRSLPKLEGQTVFELIGK